MVTVNDKQISHSANILVFIISFILPVLVLALLRSAMIASAYRPLLGQRMIGNHQTQLLLEETEAQTTALPSQQNVLAGLGPCGCPGCCSTI